jgi:transcriptional regulator with XRE-family HTH domain
MSLIFNTMAVREAKKSGFGLRLAELRKAAGLKQIELADMAHITPRMMAAYETQERMPPADKLIALAKSLKLTMDEFLGVKPVKSKADKKTVYLWSQVKKLENLPTEDKKSAVKYIDALVAKNKQMKTA